MPDTISHPEFLLKINQDEQGEVIRNLPCFFHLAEEMFSFTMHIIRVSEIRQVPSPGWGWVSEVRVLGPPDRGAVTS